MKNISLLLGTLVLTPLFAYTQDAELPREFNADEFTTLVLEGRQSSITAPVFTIKPIADSRVGDLPQAPSIDPDSIIESTEAELTEFERAALGTYFQLIDLQNTINNVFGPDNAKKLLAHRYSVSDQDAQRFVDFVTQTMNGYASERKAVNVRSCLQYRDSMTGDNPNIALLALQDFNTARATFFYRYFNDVRESMESSVAPELAAAMIQGMEQQAAGAKAFLGDGTEYGPTPAAAYNELCTNI